MTPFPESQFGSRGHSAMIVLRPWLYRWRTLARLIFASLSLIFLFKTQFWEDNRVLSVDFSPVMHGFISSVIAPLLVLVHPCLGTPFKSHVQQTLEHRSVNDMRAAAVKEAFQFAWAGYYKYAFPNDELLPVSNTYGNSRNGWGASAVDALSTAIVMEDTKIVNQILKFIPTIDYKKSYQDDQVSLFETTIRYLGGMLSGYDFLTGPLASLAEDPADVQALLTQAECLADVLSFAFDTPSGVPSNNLYINNRSTDGSTTNGLATIGTLVLEWSHLSDLTGNKTYAKLSQTGESYLLQPRPLSNQPWPGLVGTNVALVNGSFVDDNGGWVGGDDSFYEYLIKMYVYDSSRFGQYKNRWVKAADSSIKHLASQPIPRPDLTFLTTYEGRKTMNVSQHLACFDGGNFILGGSVLGRQDYVDFGLDLVAACHDTYTSTATGIGPEIFSWNTSTLPANQTAFFDTAGFWIEDSIYDLRPEVVESYYYAYQITGDSKYQDWAWDAFVAINASTRTDSGFSSIADVNVVGGGNKTDLQESFLFAELMKYSYLIHSPTTAWDVASDGCNEWVFNTEAHPFKVAKVTSPP